MRKRIGHYEADFGLTGPSNRNIAEPLLQDSVAVLAWRVEEGQRQMFSRSLHLISSPGSPEHKARVLTTKSPHSIHTQTFRA